MGGSAQRGSSKMSSQPGHKKRWEGKFFVVAVLWTARQQSEKSWVRVASVVFAVKPVGRGENPETVASHASEDVRAVQSEERAQGMTQDTNGGRRGSEKRRGQPRILFSDEAAPQELPAAIRKTERGGPEVVEDVLQGTLATVAVIEENTKGKIQPESTAALRRSVGSTPAPTLLERKGSGRFHGIGEAGGADGRQLVKVASTVHAEASPRQGGDIFQLACFAFPRRRAAHMGS